MTTESRLVPVQVILLLAVVNKIVHLSILKYVIPHVTVAMATLIVFTIAIPLAIAIAIPLAITIAIPLAIAFTLTLALTLALTLTLPIALTLALAFTLTLIFTLRLLTLARFVVILGFQVRPSFWNGIFNAIHLHVFFRVWDDFGTESVLEWQPFHQLVLGIGRQVILK